MENEFGIEQSKAFATGLFQGAEIVFPYMKDRYTLISEAEAKPQTGYKAGCLKRLWIRAYLWMQTLVKRWTGNSNLFEDIEEADRLHGSVTKAEIGLTLTEYYRTQYPKMNWQIHSRVASLGHQPPEAFYLTCGFGFRWCADFAMLCTMITLTDLDLGGPGGDFEQEWENIKSKKNSAIAHELYKFHSGAE